MFVGHPLDLIKVRLQTMPIPAAGEAPLYTGMVDCAKKTMARDGVRSLAFVLIVRDLIFVLAW